MKVAVLIPAYRPGDRLVPLVQALSRQPVERIIVIDDGSGPEYRKIFAELELIGNVTVIAHGVNRGKGAALKTGFKHIGEHLPGYGAVTADADGQHLPDDIARVAAVLALSDGNTLILGARRFGEGTPLRSRIGNAATGFIFRSFFKIPVTDTQTGLRGIAHAHMAVLSAIPYDRYEYETEAILAASRSGISIAEVPIETVYEDDNASSHFNPFLDSLRIYFVLFRFTLASLFSAAVDFAVFLVAFPFIGSILWSTYAARAVSLLVNYGLVSRRVFYDAHRARETFPRYLLLVIVSGAAASFLISLLLSRAGLPLWGAKAIAESFLYVVNFYIQDRFIFTKPEPPAVS